MIVQHNYWRAPAVRHYRTDLSGAIPTAPAAMPEEVSASSTSALGPDMALIAVPGARYEVMASVAGTVNQTSICEGFLQ